jgi:hypothetical protein
MSKLLLTVAALVIAAPAFAQSYDPGVGTGNIAPSPTRQAAPSRGYQGGSTRLGPTVISLRAVRQRVGSRLRRAIR